MATVKERSAYELIVVVHRPTMPLGMSTDCGHMAHAIGAAERANTTATANAICFRRRLVPGGVTPEPWVVMISFTRPASSLVAPVRLTSMLRVIRRFTISECNKIADKILNAPRALDVQRVLVQLFDQLDT